MAISQAELDTVNVLQKKAFDDFREQDFEKMVDAITEDCTFIVPGSVPLKGRAAIKQLVEGMYKMGIVDIKIVKEEPLPMGEHHIFKSGEAHWINRDNKADVFNFSQIWRKDDGGWLIQFLMLNSKTPPEPPSN